MGLHVGVVDYNPEATGISYADSFFCFSTNDRYGVLQAARSFQADGIMTLATDMPMRSIAYACAKMGLPSISYETAVTATDKAEMIKTLEVHNVAHPWYHVLEKPDELVAIVNKLEYPCICKPTDSSGSRGVVLVNGPDELESATRFSAAQGRSGRVIIEEFMVGSEVSVEMVIQNGKPNVVAVTDKLTTGAPHFVEMGHSQHSLLPVEDQNRIKDLAERAALALDIFTGAAHVEVMLTKDGPKIVELGARLGGDFITTHLVPLSTGVNMVKANIQIALGESPDIVPKWSRGAAIRYLQAKPGKLVKVSGMESARQIPGLCELLFSLRPGESISDTRSSSDRLGHVIACADTPEKAILICEQAINHIDILVDCN